MNKPFSHLILALVLLALSVAAYGVWFVAVDSENAKARSLAGDIQTKSQDATRIAEAKAALAALSTDEASVSAHFVSPNDIVPFLGGVESAGAALGSKVQVVSVGAAPVVSGEGHLALSVQITGSFDSVLRTLGALEYAPYDIVLTNLTLDTTGGGWAAAASFNVGTGPASSTPATPKPVVPQASPSS
ncbi:MAG: hypothetical protein JWL88_195 [Parcubacteria group bacterium]|nr:hypothetical protein [Parcubacteria group bacterium]